MAATAATLFRQAAVLVDEAVQQLDTTMRPCPHCARESYDHPKEGFAVREFAALPDKLRLAAEKLERS